MTLTRHPLLYSLLGLTAVTLFLAAVFLIILYVGNSSVGTFIPFGGSVAVVKIQGPIFESEPFIKELKQVDDNSSIKAIVLRIDSPGGAVAASQEIFEQVKKIKETKKIVVSMGTVAASGAYYIASCAHKILASPGTITGSIGVIMESFDVGELMRWAHLESRVLKSGKFKDTGSIYRELTPEERVYLQTLLDNMYQQFMGAVSEGRNIPLEEIKKLAEGKVYTGEQALKVRLVDGYGTLYDAIDEAKKLAGLAEDAHVIWPREERLPWSWLPRRSRVQGSMDELLIEHLHRLTLPVGFYLSQYLELH